MQALADFAGIEESNFFAQDTGLQRLLRRLLPEAEREPVFASLHDCGTRAAGRWNSLAIEGSRTEQLPRIVSEDRVGNPVQRVEFSPYVRQLRREVAEFGVLTRARSELHRFAMVYLLAHNGEASLNCAISCTDGLLRVLDAKGSEALRQGYRERVAGVEIPFGGAQFVTEKAGGSDIGAIEAVARETGEGAWAITGEKWFCSNPDEFFLLAARPEGAPAGTRGVGLFFVPRLLPDGRVNGLRFRRLKDKLGTRSLPTAEIDFDGAHAFCIGNAGDGFHDLMNYVINTSRLHNAANALGFMHRAFLEARNYARQRQAFGGPILRYPLVRETLAGMLAGLWRERVLFFQLLSLCDTHGTVPDERDQGLWQRCLTNMAKYRTAVGLTACIRDAILLLGGNGIVEDFSVLPRLLRDALIIETWEGTHNTLALQIVRDMRRFDFLARWNGEAERVLRRWPDNCLPGTRERLREAVQRMRKAVGDNGGDATWAETHARRLVDGLAGALTVAWMAELALESASEDAAGLLLTALAADQLWGCDADRLGGALPNILEECGDALIGEEPIPSGSWLPAL